MGNRLRLDWQPRDKGLDSGLPLRVAADITTAPDTTIRAAAKLKIPPLCPQTQPGRTIRAVRWKGQERAAPVGMTRF